MSPEAGRAIRSIPPDEEIPVEILRDFLFTALRHDAIYDALIERLAALARAGAAEGRTNLASALPRLVNEILGAATEEDWLAVADAFAEDFRDEEEVRSDEQ